MSRIPALRVIIDSRSNPGQWNMAVDEVLLESAISAGLATVRVYEWSKPTVSLGYFQNPGDLREAPSLAGLPVVRRLSGGGAILHDDELTYSVALPPFQKLFQQPHELYDLVHGGLARGLAEIGFAVSCRGQTLKRPDEPVLCFQRQNAHDLVCAGHKVLGSAQRRRRGAILQHGSLIRRASASAPDVWGLEELAAKKLPADLNTILARHVANVLAESWQIGSLTASEIDLVNKLSRQL